MGTAGPGCPGAGFAASIKDALLRSTTGFGPDAAERFFDFVLKEPFIETGNAPAFG